MKLFIYVLLLIIAGLCFYAGYALGRPGTIEERRSMSQSGDGHSRTDSESETPLITENSLPRLPERERLETPSDESLADRAALNSITLIDSEGRDLIVQVIEPGEETLRVRRLSDYRVLDIPLDRLSDEDRIFAESLWNSAAKQAPAEALISSETPERGPDVTEKALEELIRKQFSRSRFPQL